MMQFIQKIHIPKKSYKILILLLSTDLLFIVLHIAHKIARLTDTFPVLHNDAFNLYYDRTLAESFQYVKEFWIILLLAWMIFRRKEKYYWGWALMFVYLLFDDMLSLHEGVGTFILNALNIPSAHVLIGELRYQDFGELAVSLFFAAIFLIPIVLAYFRGSRDVKAIFHGLVICLLIIVFFGVVTDLADRVFDEETHKLAYELTRLFEDGGEMLGMSIMCWYVYSLTEPDPIPELVKP